MRRQMMEKGWTLRHRWLWTAGVLFLAVSPASGHGQQEVKDATDHPLVARYRGARIVGYDEEPVGTYVLALGPISRDYEHTDSLPLVGRLRRVLYLVPPGRSAEEVYRGYARQLRQAGFDEMYACAREACGYLFTHIAPHGDALVRYAFDGLTRDHHFLAAHTSTAGGDTYVAVNVVVHESPNSWMEGRTLARVDVVEVGPTTGPNQPERTP